ncbi:MAG: T9SS type A sorting domain-containing protein [Bacteroidia bacterium]
MKKFTLIILLTIFFGLDVNSQCLPMATYAPSAWSDPGTPTVQYTAFMCNNHDTLITRTNWDYYDGDGYWINLFAGSDVTFFIDGCSGNPASLTIVDSTGAANGMGVIIPGAYVAAACPNSLNFIAPYTGKYYLVFDSDGNCGNLGTAGIGYAAIKLNNASNFINCTPVPPPQNDTICGAIPVFLGTVYSENTTYASFTDDRDGEVIVAGFACSTPNNTLWYYFNPLVSGDYEFATDAPVVGGARIWLGLFDGNTCTDAIFYVDCLNGAIPGTPTADTVALLGGTTYYIMVDGFSGAIGAFSFEVNALTTGTNEINAKDFSVYPNPFTDVITIKNSSIAQNINVEIVNMVGQVIFKEQMNNLVSSNIDTKSLAKGVYFIRFISNEGIATKKLVKQ